MRWVSFGALQAAAHWCVVMAAEPTYQGTHDEKQIITTISPHHTLSNSFERMIIDDDGVHWTPIKAWAPEHAKAVTVPQVSSER